MKKKKIVNAEDNDLLNPMEGLRNDGAGTEDFTKPDHDKETEVVDDGAPEHKPFPDELIDPEEQEAGDEMP